MNIGDYVFQLEKGIGVITAIEFESITVFYGENNYSLESEDDLFIIPSNVIDFILSKEYLDYIPPISIDRAYDIINLNRVEKIVIMGSNLTTTVKGSRGEIYNVNITFTKKGIRSNCNCPVKESNCKHVAAVLIKLDNILTKLKNPSITYSKILDFIPRIKNRISNLESLNTLDSFGKFLNNYDGSDFISNLELIEQIEDINIINKIICMMYLNKNTRPYFNIDNLSFRFRKIYNSILKIDRYPEIIERDIVKRSPNLEINLLYFLTNQKYDKLFILAINSTINPTLYIDFLIDKIDINKELVDEVFNLKGVSFLLLHELKRDIFNASNNELKEYIIDKYKLVLDSEIIKELPIDLKIKELDLLDDSNLIIDVILDDFYLFYDLMPKKTLKYVYENINYAYKKSMTKLINLIKNDNELKYFYILISNYDNFNYNKNDFNPYFFFKYFDYKLKFITDYDEAYININIEIKLDNIPIISYLESINGINYSSSFNRLFIDTYIDSIINYVKNDYPNFELEYKNELLKIEDLRKQKVKKDYINKIKEFINNENDDVIIKDKVHLNYSFNEYYDYKHDKDYYELTLRIGNIKDYVIKSVSEFLERIDNKENYRYGKELEFYHDINNFTDFDIDIINYLLTLPYESNDIKTSKGLLINSKALEFLLNKFKGRRLILNNCYYEVILDNIKYDINIDSNMILKSNINYDNILKLKKLYYLDKENHQINLIDANNNESGLIEFVSKNNNMDVSVVKDEFIDEIYSRYSDLINLPANLCDDFLSNLIRIDAYFDYQKNKIILDTKIYKNDCLLTSDSFMNNADKQRFLRYTKYIKNLGFNDLNILDSDSLILNFFEMDFTDLKKLCNVYLSDNIKNKKVSKLQIPSVRIQYENNMMEAFLDNSEYNEEELLAIIKAIRQKKNFVLLSDDRIIEVENEESKEFNNLVTDLRLDIKNLFNKKKIEAYDAFKAYSYLDNINIDDYFINIFNDLKNFKDIDIKLPKLNLDTKLRKYQIDAYKWLSILSKYNLGGILADDMGLGKTLEVITTIKNDNALKPSLIICPKSLIFNWYNEFEKFDSDTKVIMIYGNLSERKNKILNIKPNEKVIYVTAYDSLRNDINLYQNIDFNYIILDEAQAIKNVNAIKSITVKSLKGLHRFALTGTPIENNIIDLWSIFDFIMPGYLDDLSIFKTRYLSDSKYTDIIKMKVSPFILRRTKDEVLKDLPPKTETVLTCTMSIPQRKIYDAHIKDANIKLNEGTSIDILAYLTRLRQICISPKLIFDEYINPSGKIEYLKEELPKFINEGHKILIFSSFVKGLNLVKDLLKELNIKYKMLTGETSILDRKNDTFEFNEKDIYKVYLISLKAGGTGLNLIGADMVIHLDPWWNISAENQATDRAHRIGQKRNVKVLKLVAENSVEERVIELQNIKRDVISKIISNDDSSITNLSLDDLKFILS